MFEQNSQAVLEMVEPQDDQARTLLDSIQDYAIFMLDLTGRVRSWNRGAERVNGYSREEILGKHFSIFYPPGDIIDGRCERELQTAETEGRFEEEGWRVRKNGERYWANVVLTAMRDAAGQVVGFAKVTRDLTERRKTEERLRHSEERFRLLVTSVKDYAIFMVGPDGRVQSWNAGAQRMKGYEAGEIIGEPITRFYPEEAVAHGKPWALLREAAEVGRVEDEGWRVRKDGSLFWADVVITAVRDERGQLRGYAKVTRDLTERQRAEAERLRLAQAEEAVRLRDEFLAIASHELKTPLTALQLQLQSLKLRGGPLEPGVTSKLDRAVHSTERLAGLIETLLDVSRLSTGQLTLKPERMELCATVRDVIDRLHEAAAHADCQVLFQEGTPVEGTWDRLRIEQVVINLLSNAFKYAAGSPVELSVSREGSDALLVIRDKGPGIPESALSRLFNRFERAASINHYGGLGLGLYVTREIVQAHGGHISVENLAEGGARFTVRLPT
ncbi:sensor histidine kinase [Archangium lansingense]|uniref:histidine kinase n=1 Tax=Archangium lansingense TaxID=2995310 RepID=A0ABT3ZWX6_9BACT|nr:PAS domain S-box protein [Archangium lansinium]MCY1073904.1 PAS domain S-box protein [Archangium lansinium]